MATWVNEQTTSSGGNISLVVSGGYGNVSRNGSSITFNWGVRFRQSSSTYTYNSICARPGGKNYYAQKSSGGIHTSANTWYYATSTSNSVAQYTGETIPFSGSGTAGGVGAGTITVTVGTAWNGYTPTADKYSYSFTVSYPAAASYTVSYNANGGSGAPGNQTKYQGYNLTLSSTVPTRAGYRFDGWSGSNGSSYSAGSTYTGDSALTLTAKWTALNPVFTAPGLTATETTLSWPAFTSNIKSYFYYKLDSGNWVLIGENTTTAPAKSVSVDPGTYHTITFRAENASDRSLVTEHSSSGTTYNYPYISNITNSVNVGGTQTFTLYNPLGRSVKVQINSINGTTITSTDEAYASQTTSTTSASFTIPINAAKKMTSTKSATIVYSCIYGSSAITKSGTITVPDSLGPSITDSKKLSFFEYTDCATVTIGSTVYAMSTVTGSATRFLQGKSKMKYRLVSANNPFTPQYGASISTYKVKINSKEATATTIGTYYYEGTTGGVTTEANAQTVTATNTYTITISATDSRGITSLYNLTFTTYPYSTPKPVISQVYRTDGYGTGVTLIIAGTWSPNMTGQHIANTITLLYKQSGTSIYNSKVLYSDTGSATSYKALAGTYNLASSPISLSFDSDKAWDFKIEAKDVFNGVTTSEMASITLGEPIMFVDVAQVGVGINCFPNGKGLFVEGVERHPGALVGQSSDTATAFWYKFASASTSNAYSDFSVSFKVSAGYKDNSTALGILTAHVRTGSTGAYEDGQLVWEYAGTGVTPSYFKLAHNTSTAPTSVELWCYCPASWQQFHFDVITTGTRTDRYSNLWTFYNTVTENGQSEITSDYTTLDSTLMLPRIFKGTGAPSGGANGDIYIKYS